MHSGVPILLMGMYAAIAHVPKIVKTSIKKDKINGILYTVIKHTLTKLEYVQLAGNLESVKYLKDT